MYKGVSIKKQKDLEYEIYYFFSAVSLVKKIYIRNWHLLNKMKDTKFIDERGKNTSDLMTTKKVNKDYIQENNTVEMQSMVIDWLKEKEKMFTRLADFINDERINDLAMAKRQ